MNKKIILLLILIIITVFSCKNNIKTKNDLSQINNKDLIKDTSVMEIKIVDQFSVNDYMFNIINLNIDNDYLIITVEYNGGLQSHDFVLEWNNSYLKSMPPQVDLKLIHFSNNDEGKMRMEKIIKFSIAKLQKKIKINLTNNYGYSKILDY